MKTAKSILFPDTYRIKDETTREILEQFLELIESNHSDYYEDLKLDVRVLSVNDVTPSVKNGKVFKTANTQATAITNFDDGQQGQIITVIINDTNTSIADSGNFKLSAAFNPNADDVIQLVYDGVSWLEVSRSAN